MDCIKPLFRAKLYQAAFQGKKDIVRSILNAKDLLVGPRLKNQETALIGAIKGSQDEIVQLILNQRDEDNNTILHLEAEQGNEKIVALILQKAPQLINKQTSTQKITPLMNALFEDHIHIASLLLKHGADPSLKDNIEYNVFHLAAYHGQDKMIKLLLKQHTPQMINTPTINKSTPLMLAAQSSHYSVVKLLLEHYIGCS